MNTTTARRAERPAAPAPASAPAPAANPTARSPSQPGQAGWRDRWWDRWFRWRDRRLRDPQFQRWAVGFFLTRPIAQRRAQGLFDLMAGFVYTQVLLACVRLRLFDLLADAPLQADVIAQRLQLPLDATLRLLDAAVALRLLELRGAGRYGVGSLGAPLVGNAALAAMTEHHATLYRDLTDPVALLRQGAQGSELGHYYAYAGATRPDQLTTDRVQAYSQLMAASQPLVAQEVLDAYRFDRHRVLLDVGGGDGAFLTAVAPRAPQLSLRLFDLPAVAELARARFAANGLAARTDCVGGDFFNDPLPAGADLISLVRVAFDHPDEQVLRLLRNVRRALPPGGVVLLAEPMSDVPGVEAMGDAYFGMYLLAMGRGRPRSAQQLAELLHQAGFDPVDALPTRMPLQAGLLLARAASA
ncbi:MAG: methyltransferase [Leptothrix sp. (in: b-proteobacteria)]